MGLVWPCDERVNHALATTGLTAEFCERSVKGIRGNKQ